jgi:hypothetical protein
MWHSQGTTHACDIVYQSFGESKRNNNLGLIF